MKTFTAAYQTELDKPVATLAGCLKVVRQDNVTYLSTSHDKDIVVNTGEVYDGTYLAADSFTPTAFSFTSDLAVDNFDITNYIDNVTINEIELVNDIFANAEVWYFSVNYKTPTGEVTATDGIDKVFHGYIGQVSFTENRYIAEVRSLSTKLTKKTGEVFSKICRTTLGSPKCGVILDQAYWQPATTYTLGTKVKATTYDGRWYVCTTPGTSDAVTEPTWDTTVGNPTSDLAPLVWTAEDSLRKVWTVGGTNPGSYFKYFRMLSINSANGSSGPGFLEIEILDTEGINLITTVGVTASATGSWSAGYGPEQTIDGSIVTKPYASNTNLVTVTYTFDTQVIGRRYRIYASSGSGTVPDDWTAQISLNGVDWFTIYTHVNEGLSSLAWSPYWEIAGGISIPGSAVTNSRIRIPLDLDSLYPDDYYKYGVLTWITGANSVNRNMHEIKKSTSNPGYVDLFLPTLYDVTFGDTFNVTVGCNRHYIGSDGTTDTGDCITKFDNGINFRGEPYIPSEDLLIGGNGPVDKDE